jgi:hypothetical protein
MRSHSPFLQATLLLAVALAVAGPARAQVAGGTTTVAASITESTELAMGWSVRRTLLGKTLHDEGGRAIGTVDDLIISPDKRVSYVIVGAGGFVGIGRHDVAIPVLQIQEQSGRLVMAGATPDTIRSMPAFVYATDTARRDAFVAAADQDIARGRAKLADLDKQAAVVDADAKARIAVQSKVLHADMAAAEARVSEMKKATVVRWKEFEAGVSAATARLRQSIDKATG